MDIEFSPSMHRKWKWTKLNHVSASSWVLYFWLLVGCLWSGLSFLNSERNGLYRGTWRGGSPKIQVQWWGSLFCGEICLATLLESFREFLSSLDAVSVSSFRLYELSNLFKFTRPDFITCCCMFSFTNFSQLLALDKSLSYKSRHWSFYFSLFWISFSFR